MQPDLRRWAPRLLYATKRPLHTCPLCAPQDLDLICLRNIDFLLHYEFVAPKTSPIGVSNDLMVSVPRGKFVLRLTQQLAGWKKRFFIKCVRGPGSMCTRGRALGHACSCLACAIAVPAVRLPHWSPPRSAAALHSFFTVMLSTGPMFVSLQMALHQHKEDLAVLSSDLYTNGYDTCFKHIPGSSWHGPDGRAIMWLSKHVFVTAGLLAVATGVALLARLPRTSKPVRHEA